MIVYRVVKHDLTSIQWEHIEPLPQTFTSAAAAEMYAVSLQMGAVDCRVQYVVEVSDDDHLPA